MACTMSIQPFTGGDFEEFEECLESLLLCQWDWPIGIVASSASAMEKATAVKKGRLFLYPCYQLKCIQLWRVCVHQRDEVKYQDIRALLRDYYKPAVSQVSATYHFHQCRQKDNKSTQDFVIHLKKLVLRCNSGMHLDRALRDQFLVGIRNTATQSKLLNCHGVWSCKPHSKSTVNHVGNQHCHAQATST